jgi:signal transduction histidine kinase
MADRMAAVDGALIVDSAPGAGTRVVVRAPLG